MPAVQAPERGGSGKSRRFRETSKNQGLRGGDRFFGSKTAEFHGPPLPMNRRLRASGSPGAGQTFPASDQPLVFPGLPSPRQKHTLNKICTRTSPDSSRYRIHFGFSPKGATLPFIVTQRIPDSGARAASHRKQDWRRLRNRARLRTGRGIASPPDQGSERRREWDHGS
jgi:hypothetical protein